MNNEERIVVKLCISLLENMKKQDENLYDVKTRQGLIDDEKE